MKRRSFIQKGLVGSLLIGSGRLSLAHIPHYELIKLTILHTNDVHSRIEPFPEDGSRNAGQGGAVRRAALINRIRSESDHVLLLDAGDIFQGTPYFNYFHGELEFKLMSEMGYDAATIGNHDFDAGMENLVEQMGHGGFDMINCNYDFRNTPLNGKTHPYRIYQFNEVKIGILGVGVELKGLVADDLFGETQYRDPILDANRAALILKEEEKCDYVICLSHLGYRYRNDKVSDWVLAQETKNIDLIIGGHTHTFLNEPTILKNLDGEEVIINQVGWAGIKLGRIDVTFERNRRNKCITCTSLDVG